MRTHILKCWTEQFAEVRSGRKTFEFRRDDRGFAVGDVLDLRDFDPVGMMYSGLPDSKRNKSGVRGVSWDRKRRKWYASIRVSNKTKALGRYDDIDEASAAYQAAVKRHRGHFLEVTQ